MALNYVKDGDVLDYQNGGTAIAAGAVVLVGKRIGVALSAIAANAIGPLGMVGVWNISKASADVVAQGDLLYWDNTNGRLTTSASGNTQAGFADAAAGNGATTVNIKINA